MNLKYNRNKTLCIQSPHLYRGSSHLCFTCIINYMDEQLSPKQISALHTIYESKRNQQITMYGAYCNSCHSLDVLQQQLPQELEPQLRNLSQGPLRKLFFEETATTHYVFEFRVFHLPKFFKSLIA